MITATRIEEVQQELVHSIQHAIPDINVCQGMGLEQLFGSLEEPLITVMVRRVIAKQAYLDDYVGTTAGSHTGSEIYAKNCHVDFSITVFLPYEQAETLHENIFLSICNMLLFDHGCDFQEISCKETTFDQRIQAFVIEIQASATLILTKQEDYIGLREVSIQPGRIQS